MTVKLPAQTQVGGSSQAQALASAASMPALLQELKNASSIAQIGDALGKIAGRLEGAEGANVTQALAEAQAKDPSGVRPLTARVKADEVKLFCGQAAPPAVWKDAEALGLQIEKSEFKLFQTGDPFTKLGTSPNKATGDKGENVDVHNKTVVVYQGDAAYTPKEGQPKYDLPTLVAEALQVAWAARQNNAKRVIVYLPESLNPKTHPNDPFAQLVSVLADAQGVNKRDLRFHPGLDRVQVTTEPAVDGAIQAPTVRQGLPALGPKASEAQAAITKLESATDLAGVKKALGELDLAITGLKGKYAEAAGELAGRVAEVLTAKVSQLVPDLFQGSVEATDKRVVVFGGHANPELASRVALAAGAAEGKHRFEFNGQSPFVALGTDVRGKDVVVVQSTRQDPFTAPEDRMSAPALMAEALMLCKQAKEGGAKKVKLVLPYMLNARSDKQDQKGVGAYVAMVAAWIKALKLADVVLVEPHDVHTPNLLFRERGQVHVLSGAEILCRRVMQDAGSEGLVMVRPDAGAAKRTEMLAKDLGLVVVDGEKSRSDNSGTTAELKKLSGGDVFGKKCLVSDDEIATGGTMQKLVAKLKESGATEVFVAVTHANMPDTVEERWKAMRALRDAGATKLYLGDTQPIGKLPADLQGFVVPVTTADAIAKELV